MIDGGTSDSSLWINSLLVFSGTLDGSRERQQYDKLLEDPMLKFSGLHQQEKADLMVVCQVFADGEPLALSVSTSYKAFSVRWR